MEPHTAALCAQCGNPYHLNQRQDLEGKDCGDVWISEEHMALEFACNTCLQPQDALEAIIDLDEAAAVAGVEARVLQSAAEAGELQHRRTSGGILLFNRADVERFAAQLRASAQ